MALPFPVIKDEDLPKIVPALGVYIKTLADYESMGVPLKHAETSLRTCDIMLSVFCEGLQATINDYDYDEKEIELIAQGFSLFERLGQIFSLSYYSLRNNEHDLTILNLIALIETLKQLEKVVEQQREYRNNKPRISEASGLDDILKAGQAVLAGRREWAFLTNKLERLRPAAEVMCSKQHNPAYVQEHCDALQNMFAVCAANDAENLPAALENLKKTGEAFLAVDIDAMETGSSPSFSCPLCGASVRQWDKKCPSCNAKMPDRSYEQDVVPAEAFDLPRYLNDVSKLADQLREGTKPFSAFSAKVQSVADNVSYIIGRLKSMTAHSGNNLIVEYVNLHGINDILDGDSENLAHALEYFQELGTSMQGDEEDNDRDSDNDSDNSAADYDVSPEELLDVGLEYFVAAVDSVRQIALDVRELENINNNDSSDYYEK